MEIYFFQDLLHQAEETERIARAASASGSELVRHCNPSARRQQRHAGGRRKSARRGGAVSESVRHGGSLDNLAKEELFLETAHTLMVMRDRPAHSRGGRAATPAVSARQREGGKFDC